MSVAIRPDVAGDLRRIHAVITRALDVSARYCNAPAHDRAAESGSAHEGFFTYVDAFARLLHAHHLVEDEIAFPRLRALVPEMPYDRLTAEHRQVAAALEEITRAVATGRSSGDTEQAKDAVGRTLNELSSIWHPHIAQEETHLTRDRLEQILSLEEHGALAGQISEHSRLHATPDYLVLPFMLYSLPPEDRAVMAAHLPPIVLEQLVPIAWAEKWSPMKPFLLQ